MRKRYGFESINEAAMQHVKYIRRAIEMSKNEPLLKSFGLQPVEIESSSDDDTTDDEIHHSDFEDDMDHEPPHLNTAQLVEVVKSSQFNYFEIHEQLGGQQCQELIPTVTPHLAKSEISQLQLSFEAFIADEELNSSFKLREARALNGVIVSDSEPDDTEKISQVKNVLDESKKEIVLKKRMSLKCAATRLKMKRVAQSKLLRRRISCKAKGIVKRFPDISERIEQFVRQNNVEADHWRRTGVLTFDGNAKNTQKVTYEKIRQRLGNHYKHKFSYDSFVSLETKEGAPLLGTKDSLK